MSGLIAGVSVDVPLHPLDTVKTRLKAQVGFRASGGYKNLWSGLSAMLATTVPAVRSFSLSTTACDICRLVQVPKRGLGSMPSLRQVLTHLRASGGCRVKC